jgi:hypothetical protein
MRIKTTLTGLILYKIIAVSVLRFSYTQETNMTKTLFCLKIPSKFYLKYIFTDNSRCGLVHSSIYLQITHAVV